MTKFGTKAIHGGLEERNSFGAVMTPIYQTSTYIQAKPGDHEGYEYSRSQNPTRFALERNLAAIENGRFGFAFSSGLAAIDAVLKLFNPGDEIIAANDLYGGTHRLYTKVFSKYGLKFHFVDMQNVEAIEEYVNENTKLIWIETPTNPMLNIIDIKGASDIAKKYNCLLGVDNTFASPYLQNPLDLGADIVMHSATKYLGGHSDLVMGALIVNDKKLAEDIYFIQYATGAVAGPQDSFLALRGIKTLHVRMKQHCENARTIADFLSNHPKIENLYYPGLPTHRNHEIAKKQMRDFGGMISFTLKGDKYEDAEKFLTSTHLFALAESLGGVESLVNHPASMTHASIPKEVRDENGIKDTLIRLSVGIEDVEDLIDDLKQALDNI
ncbi:MAG TPA: cystathionine gamma-synthase [Flavobacteriales bacterium]|nr:cystathionine gamma-synthase [Flavobacteriales bacterium]|tara:strand:+ start:110084 stop:111232 length:1149 start_codon:yes stop_codon:yes gene_type:complete